MIYRNGLYISLQIQHDTDTALTFYTICYPTVTLVSDHPFVHPYITSSSQN